MNEKYKNDLYNPKLSFDSLIDRITIPKHLYKYQYFFSDNHIENIYWKENIQGAFHLSRGCEFEDTNDCKPFIDINKVCEIIESLLKKINTPKSNETIMSIKAAFQNDYIKTVESNYQKDIRIGCFTTSSNSKRMWNKYGNDSTGFCMEYNTDQNKLLKYSTLPILYTDEKYDSSVTLANQLIIEINRKAKGRTLSEDIDVMQEIYQQILKTVYIPIFIKKTEWSFEEEYRLFLLKHRNTPIGMIKAEDELNEHNNIDLKSEVSAIYLGENFHLNPNYEQLKKQVTEIAVMMKIRIFQKKLIGNEYIDIPIV